jgi:hypothetical protein
MSGKVDELISLLFDKLRALPEFLGNPKCRGKLRDPVLRIGAYSCQYEITLTFGACKLQHRRCMWPCRP